MKFSALSEQYDGMRTPGYILKIEGTEITAGDDAHLVNLVCELNSRREAGFLYLEMAFDPSGENGSQWLTSFQLGSTCTLSLGYGKNQTQVFSGILYDINWEDPLDSDVMTIEAVCLDALGCLMLSSSADAGAARTMSQMITDILGQAGCSTLAPTTKIGDFPADWDLPAQRTHTTDYAVVRRTAEFFCYEFYAYADELNFGPPRTETSACVSFENDDGLMEMKRSRTLKNQCAAIAVSGTDDAGEQIYAREARLADSGFGSDKMGSALSGDLYQPELFVRTMAQATYLAKARIDERQRKAGGLTGRSVGLPDIRPGRFVEVSGLSEPVNGSYYITFVQHTLNESGFETYFEAED